MKTTLELNLKSCLVGAAAAAALFFATGAASEAPGAVGRYQMKVGADNKVAILDTTNGQCWTGVIQTNGSVTSTVGQSVFGGSKN